MTALIWTLVIKSHRPMHQWALTPHLALHAVRCRVCDGLRRVCKVLTHFPSNISCRPNCMVIYSSSPRTSCSLAQNLRWTELRPQGATSLCSQGQSSGQTAWSTHNDLPCTSCSQAQSLRWDCAASARCWLILLATPHACQTAWAICSSSPRTSCSQAQSPAMDCAASARCCGVQMLAGDSTRHRVIVTPFTDAAARANGLSPNPSSKMSTCRR